MQMNLSNDSGAIPVMYSVLGDLFPSKQRVLIAVAVVTTGLPEQGLVLALDRC